MAGETTESNTKSHHVLIVAAIILLVLVGIGWALWPKLHNKSPGLTANSSQWAEFKSSQYGLGLSYPKAWGAPEMRDNSSYAQGKKYLIVFPRSPKGDVYLAMDSDNLTQKVCESENKCTNIPAITKTYVEQQISKSSASFMNHTDNSYSTVSKPVNGQSVLTIYQAVSLNKLNVSAVKAVFSDLKAPNTCQQNHLSSGQSNCITQEDYNNLKTVVDSIKSL